MTDQGPRGDCRDEPTVRTWIRVPGMLCTSRIFTALDPHLHLSGRVVDAPLQGPSLDQATDHLLAVAHHRPGPVGAIGVSLGAIVVMAAAIKIPECFDSVVLISTNPRAPRPEQRDAWTLLARRIANGRFAEITMELAPSLFAPRTVTPGLLQAGEEMARQLGGQVLLEQLRLQLSRRDLRSDLSRIRSRTLVLAGGDDLMCSTWGHTDIAMGIPGAELHILDGLGHLMTLEDPARVAERINCWDARSTS